MTQSSHSFLISLYISMSFMKRVAYTVDMTSSACLINKRRSPTTTFFQPQTIIFFYKFTLLKQPLKVLENLNDKHKLKKWQRKGQIYVLLYLVSFKVNSPLLYELPLSIGVLFVPVLPSRMSYIRLYPIIPTTLFTELNGVVGITGN